MPPKRRAPTPSESTSSVATTSLGSGSQEELAPPPAKKAKIVDDEDGSGPHTLSIPVQVSASSSSVVQEEDEENSDDEDDGRKICSYANFRAQHLRFEYLLKRTYWHLIFLEGEVLFLRSERLFSRRRYDEGCYRKNPNHFTEFRHPKLKAKLKKQRKTDSSLASHPMFMFSMAKATKPAPAVSSSSSSSSTAPGPKPSLMKKRTSLTAEDLQTVRIASFVAYLLVGGLF